MVELLLGLNAPRNVFQLDRSLDDQLAPLTVPDIGGSIAAIRRYIEIAVMSEIHKCGARSWAT